MLPAVVVKEPADVTARLAELFGVTVEELILVAMMAAGARANAVENDPITAAGTFAYMAGTRGLRELFRPKGWVIDRAGGVESVFSADHGRKVVFQNAELAADLIADPVTKAGKGNSSEEAVRSGQGSLFPEIEREERSRAQAAVWYYFVFVAGDDVRAELSFPRGIEDGRFTSFHERIIILKKGDLTRRLLARDDGPPPVEFDVQISRK